MNTNPLIQRVIRLALAGKVHPNTVYRTLSSDEFSQNMPLTEEQFNTVMWTYMVEYHAREIEGYDLIG
jgi:hypothetical protein